MNVAIYSNSSFGGCYEYAKQIAQAYCNNAEIKNCYALFPKGGGKGCSCAVPKLMKDKIFSRKILLLGKIYFIIRSILNPLKAFRFAKKNNINLFIFNDFDQVSSFFWTRMFKKRTFKVAIILHDPDRTAYFSRKKWSESSMQRIMDVVDIAFYHEKLPDLPYYKNSDQRILYAKIPHGIYPPAPDDLDIKQTIKKIKDSGLKIVSITGNIRTEKNYRLAIQATAKISNIALLIAGRTVTTQENIDDYKNYAKENNVEDRVFFLTKYLNNSEMSTILKYSDIVLLYYSQTFKSQSGILNSLTPFSPKLIVSDTDSGMAYSARRFKLAKMVVPDNVDALIDAIKNYPEQNPYEKSWKVFEEYSSWKRNIEIQISTYKKILQTKNDK